MTGQKVVLDSALASLYGVPTSRFNEAVKRNRHRFPEDFMFQLTVEEHRVLTSQFAIPKKGRGGRRTRPYAFTEHGALAAAFVLNTSIAIEVGLQVRTFVKLRQLLATHEDLARKLENLERRYDERFQVVFEAIRELMQPPEKPRRKIGFRISTHDQTD